MPYALIYIFLFDECGVASVAFGFEKVLLSLSDQSRARAAIAINSLQSVYQE